MTLEPRGARLATLLIAACCLGTVQAAGLYRWIEADGSITFSPNPPPAGTAFELVDAEGSEGAADPGLAASDRSAASAPATSDPLDPLQADVGEPAADAARKRAAVSYAPPPLGAASESRESLRRGEPSTDATTTDPAPATDVATANTPAAVRRARCQELEKRVVSLERRLGTRLSPEDMDNTVLYMARYQASVDRHCRN